jgi:hypothetical protein
VPRILDETARTKVATGALDLARRLLARFASAPHIHGTLEADMRDDELIAHDEAATLILSLQDRTTRDRAAEWMEHDEAAPALRLWRALARRCVGPYGEHAAAPLTLAGWVAWSAGDELEAREALAMALGADPDYVFARLLHQACNEGLDPESIRQCLRKERAQRAAALQTVHTRDTATSAPRAPTPSRPRTVVQHADAAPSTQDRTPDDAPEVPRPRSPRRSPRPESRSPGCHGPQRTRTAGTRPGVKGTGTTRPPRRRDAHRTPGNRQ